jgi:putative thioredoxin
MSDFMSRASLAGAVDLSSLRKPDPSLSSKAPAAPATAVAPADLLKLPSLVAQGNETNLRNFIELSSQVAVIIEFYAGWSEQSKALTPKLTKLVQAFAGRVVLLQIDLDSNVNVAKAFKVGSAPTVLALLRGQPVPLFDGDQPEANIQVVFERVLEIAAENGIAGVVSVEGPVESELPPALPPRHQAAYDAIDAGDYQLAVSEYQAALRENPADSLASTGLAQVNLLIRTEGIDFEKVLSSAPESASEVLLKADACMAVGHPAQAFSTILTRFASVFGDEREVLRKHLLELFTICPPDLPELADARRQLAALLY